MLLRVAKRRTSWQPGVPIQDLLETEFRTPSGNADLSPSVYEIPSTQQNIVRAHSEHAASAGLDPPRGGNNIDFSGWPNIQSTPGNSAFLFTSARHREMAFANIQELRSFVETVLLNLQQRIRPTTKQELVTYSRERIAARDVEWLEFCHNSPGSKGQRWGCDQ